MPEKHCKDIVLTTTSKLDRPPEEDHYATFQRLRCDKDHVDFVIVCGDREFRAHSEILVMKCRYFARVFKRDWVENVTGRIELHDDDSTLVADMLDYIYAETEFRRPFDKDHMERALYYIDLWFLADKYEVDGLKSCIEKRLGRSFDPGSGNWTVQELLRVIDAVYERSLTPTSVLRYLIMQTLFDRKEAGGVTNVLRTGVTHDELRKRPEFMLDATLGALEVNHKLRSMLRPSQR